MENKLLLQDMAELLARHDGISRKSADAFVRTFFDVVQKGLESDQLVKIKGFGTFKLVEVSERESVNINTGERFQIGGHTKVSFTPDNSLKEAVNRPFAHFQTVILNEETDIEELESVQDEIIEDTESAKMDVNIEDIEEKESVEETPATNAQHTQTLTDDDVQIAKNDTPIIISPSEEVEEIPEVNASNVEDVLQPAAQDMGPVSVMESSDFPQDREEQDGPAAKPIDASPKEMADVATGIPPMKSQVMDTDSDEQQNTSEFDQDAENSDDVKYLVSEGTLRHYRRWKIIALTLFTLILMLLSYFAGYFKIFCPCEWIVPEKPVTTQQMTVPVAVPQKTTPQKTTAPDTTSPQPTPNPDMPKPEEITPQQPTASKPSAKPVTATPAKTQTPQPKQKKRLPQVKGGKYVITGTRQSYRVDRGETLRSIAEHIYGSKGYVNYIIVHNNISSPDNVAAGTIIQLPELELKE